MAKWWWTIWGWYPPVGIYIALLALMAVLVPILRDFAKMSRREKAIWTVVMFSLMLLEVKSIYQDRNAHDKEQAEARAAQLGSFTKIASGIDAAIAQSQQQFEKTLGTEKGNLAQTMGGLKETMNATTGGAGFCYVALYAYDYAGRTNVNASIVVQGKYPLTNVNAMVTDDDIVIQQLEDLSKGKVQSAEEFGEVMNRAQEWLRPGDLPPGFPEAIPMRAAIAPVHGDSRLLTINFWANNGNWFEKIALHRANGQWLKSIRVWKPRLDEKKRAVVNDEIFTKIDPGYPVDANSKDPGGVSVPR